MEHLVLRGSAFARGVKLGERFGVQHAAFTAPGWEKLSARAAAQWPRYRLEAMRGNMLLAMEQYAPELVTQMRGMAAGAGIPVNTLISRELTASIGLMGSGFPSQQAPDPAAAALVSAGSCTNVGGVTVDTGPVLAKTDDGTPLPTGGASPFTILEERPDDGMAYLIVGKHGQLKVEVGLNAAGVAIGQSSQSTLPGADGFGIPEFLLARVALARCRSTAEVVDFLVGTPSAGKGLSMMVVDAGGDVAAVEKWANRSGVRRRQGAALSFANDFLAPEMQDFPARNDKANSAHRLRVIQAALDAGERLSLATLRRLLATHAPAGAICRHGADTPSDDRYATLAGFLVTCRERTLAMAEGYPCSVPFQTFQLGGNV